MRPLRTRGFRLQNGCGATMETVKLAHRAYPAGEAGRGLVSQARVGEGSGPLDAFPFEDTYRPVTGSILLVLYRKHEVMPTTAMRTPAVHPSLEAT